MNPLLPPREARLALSDGTVYVGQSFGAKLVRAGEICFNTSSTGYQEIVTDPSYAGQIVVMTSSQIGNVGTNAEDNEAARPFLSGLAVKELCRIPSSHRAREPLDAFLARQGIPALSGIDTRALVRRIREAGVQSAAISTDPDQQDDQALVALARSATPLGGRDLTAEVTCKAPYLWSEGSWRGALGYLAQEPRPSRKLRVVVYDYGVKRSILRMLVDQGFEVYVLPASTPAQQALELNPQGIFLSNGPGDPASVCGAPETVLALVRRGLPIFGVCLGHQILGLALGGKTHKLKFGHHGGNQPIQHIGSKRIAICAENHGYAVDAASLAAAGEAVAVTHRNLNDGTVEGLAHTTLPLFSVQFHPEASPGPHDAQTLFRRFRELVERHASGEQVSGAMITMAGHGG